MDDAVAQFTGITGSSPTQAQQYLRLADGNLEQAIQLFFDTGALDLEGPHSAAPPSFSQPASHPPPSTSAPSQPPGTRSRDRVDDDGVVHLDSDDDMSDVQEQYTPGGFGGATHSRAQPGGPSAATGFGPPSALSHDTTYMDEDEDAAMARRLQEEDYASGAFDGDVGHGASLDGVRAPIARTTETLVGPGPDLADEPPNALRAALDAQLAARHSRATGRPGIFNQRATAASVWDESSPNPGSRRQVLSQATGGASEASSKASLLAEMYRPPHELMCRLPWDHARQEGKANNKWILVNVQDPAIFDCQVLNRDIWKNQQIKETVKENFVFMQYTKDDPRGSQYVQFYFKDTDVQDAYPHIAIVDPRTGEQVKLWSGPPVPKPMDFLMQIHEFLDRYSLDVSAKNPVATRKREGKASVDVEKLSEEEMMDMALRNSLANGADRADEDPDALTRAAPPSSKGKAKATGEASDFQPGEAVPGSNGEGNASATVASPFSRISASKPHVEPAADPARVTRIQFKHSGGRTIRRFALSDPVRRLYEFLKAEPFDGQQGSEFELVCMGRNLMDCLDDTIEAAGLKNQTIMIEFLED
ncbi:MAG: hypothetical protein M1817_001846 [Caeruleum heppii]|nr:MAG: hypothetical protein M1817_001846 [Caeruleum heppii]